MLNHELPSLSPVSIITYLIWAILRCTILTLSTYYTKLFHFILKSREDSDFAHFLRVSENTFLDYATFSIRDWSFREYYLVQLIEQPILRNILFVYFLSIFSR